jgi:two-component system chemotaxis response regulator CheB
VVSALLEYSIGRDPRLEVWATVASAEHALQLLKRGSPDVIAMDIRLPGMDGLEATRRIMSEKPIPIVVVAATVDSESANTLAMDALRAGALTVLEKPVGISNALYEVLAGRLCTQLVIMSQVSLVRTHRSTAAVFGSPGVASIPRSGRFRMLGIVCSTGGPGALIQLLGSLGSNFPIPVLLVQHMTPGFLSGFALWLGSVCRFPVVVATQGCVPTASHVYVAPADRHLRLEAGRLHLDVEEPICYQRPSGTALFQSMARDLGPDALCLLLTGMGEDGASGLLEIRRRGGYTIAEDESTAVVYGMPGAAVRLGAVCESLPLPAIAPRVLDLVTCKNS